MESGVIEAYCLGQLDAAEMREAERRATLYPEIRTEIDRTDATLRQLATEIPVLRACKENILHTLRQLHLEQEMRLDQLPLLSRHSDHQQWLNVVRTLRPTSRMDGIDFLVLQETPNLVQTLIWMEDALEETGHDADNFQESILVLEGECECNLGGQIVRLGAGGYLDIPPNTP
ncbi:MAG: hypothetical protein ABIQ93_15710, partial [Saprospiraceae bacterium]